MRNIGLFIALWIGSCLSGVGQEYKDFDLSTYKLPDIVRNQLDFSLESSGSFTDFEESGSSSSIKGNFQTAFNRYKNTRSFMGNQQASLRLNGDYSKNSLEEKKRNYDIWVNYTNSSRFYGNNLLFFETGGVASFNVNGFKSFGHVNEEVKSTYTRVNLQIPLRVGKGRIERVEDARQAIYILDNLSKRKVLDRKLSNEEIQQFAQLISTVKNKRFLDARLRMIDEITTVDSFLVKNNLLATAGATYFTTLYDYWMYGDLFERKAGTEFSGGITPGFMYKRNESEFAYKTTVPSVSADISFDYEKPVNLYWQRSAKVRLSGLYEYQDDQFEDKSYYDENIKKYGMNLMGRYAFGYYPTSRTYLNAGIQEDLGWNKLSYKDSPKKSGSYVLTNSSVFFNMYYYFSPQLRLALEGSFGYYYQGIEDVDYTKWNGSFLATLTYSLF